MEYSMDLKDIKVIVFDIGGTLMEFTNMPLNWSNYYNRAFHYVNNMFQLDLTENDIDTSVDMLKSLNPRLTRCEKEIPPEELFVKCTRHWRKDLDFSSFIPAFFDSFHLSAKVFDYAIPLITELKNNGKTVGLLTDLPNGMPDDYFKKYVPNIIENCDFYISSQSCGYRKPNPYVLKQIADTYSVNKNEIFYIGDEPKDKAMAQNFGCNFMNIKNFLILYSQK